MKKANKTILSLLLLLSLFVAMKVAEAANSFLYVDPPFSTISVGENINSSVLVGTYDKKVCAIKGTLVFNNLVCKNITVSNGLIAKTLPTCLNPSFLIGIPKCTTKDQILLTVSMKANNPGNASISLAGIHIIGEGASVAASAVGGDYHVNDAANKAESQTNQNTEIKNPESSDEQAIELVDQTAALGQARGLGALLDWAGSNIIWILIAVIISAGLYFFSRAKKKKKE